MTIIVYRPLSLAVGRLKNKKDGENRTLANFHSSAFFLATYFMSVSNT